ncbi:MAG: hypothetical protein L6Q78_12065 [Bacteroidia bacterium]|nr:hypothetical protein [Bacteroidia bacterium]
MRLLLFILLIYSKQCFSQPISKLFFENDTINRVDKKGRRVGYCQIYYFNSDFDKIVVSEGNYREGRRVGTWMNYFGSNIVTHIDTIFKDNEVVLLYNKGEYLTIIRNDSNFVVHHGINELGERYIRDKCFKDKNGYICKRYSYFGIHLQTRVLKTFDEVLKLIFN